MSPLQFMHINVPAQGRVTESWQCQWYDVCVQVHGLGKPRSAIWRHRSMIFGSPISVVGAQICDFGVQLLDAGALIMV